MLPSLHSSTLSSMLRSVSVPLRSEAVTPVPVEKDEERMAVKKFCYVSNQMSAPSGDQRATDQSVRGFPCLQKEGERGA